MTYDVYFKKHIESDDYTEEDLALESQWTLTGKFLSVEKTIELLNNNLSHPSEDDYDIFILPSIEVGDRVFNIHSNQVATVEYINQLRLNCFDGFIDFINNGMDMNNISNLLDNIKNNYITVKNYNNGEIYNWRVDELIVLNSDAGELIYG